MRFLYKQYQAKKKEIIEVEIDRPARVKFMTASEFKKYKNSRTHSFYGGSFQAGKVRFVLPFDSVWNAVIEKGTWSAPLQVTASTRLVGADRDARSTVALDAPEHVRALLEDEDAVALSQAGRSEG